MDEVRNWKAKRSGAGMTITGQGPDGAQIKLVDIVLIAPGNTDEAVQPGTGKVCPVATDDRGQQWRLA